MCSSCMNCRFDWLDAWRDLSRFPDEGLSEHVVEMGQVQILSAELEAGGDVT
jgi:hypothetical protein